MATPAKYVDLKVPALRDMCAARGLDSTGLRRDLIARLERKDRVVEDRERGVRLREGGGGGGGGYRGTAFLGRRLENDQQGGDGKRLDKGAEQGQKRLEGRVTMMESHGQDLERRQQGDHQVRNAEFSPGTTQQEEHLQSFHHRSEQRTPEGPQPNLHNKHMSSAPALPHRQYPSNDPHPHDDPSIIHLSEAELADILVANYTPFEPDRNGYDRRAKIRAEHDVKFDEARKKKDTAIAKATTKFNTEVDKLKVEREGELQELESDLQARREKDQRWNPAFARLKSLREARGLQIHPRDFAPRASYNNHMNHQNQTYRPAPQLPPPNTHSASPPQSFSSSTSTPTLKRKPTSPLRPHYQRQDREAAPTAAHSPTPNVKRTCSDRARSHQALPSSSQSTSQSPNLQPPFPPPSPSPHNLTSPTHPLLPTLTHLPYIFLPTTNNMTLSDVKALLAECPHTHAQVHDLQIRADQTGHFLIFEESERGEGVAERCLAFFDGERMDGSPVAMELHRREVVG
ncbi:hypothetical protein BKA64DRAFT_746849 [Cadophora sp. MPI-SDFR-AT-0126]|nr:hypothetical protein BKA64DRAFT_746849 [Leotiomycetes sp. MPI-SDFR-AT-0126]